MWSLLKSTKGHGSRPQLYYVTTGLRHPLTKGWVEIRNLYGWKAWVYMSIRLLHIFELFWHVLHAYSRFPRFVSHSQGGTVSLSATTL